MSVVAFVDDLMDRSRITSAVEGVRYQRAIGGDGVSDVEVEIVIIDLLKHAGSVVAIRAHYPAARLIGFAPHVDAASTNAALMGVDVAVPRSRFFRDITAVMQQALHHE